MRTLHRPATNAAAAARRAVLPLLALTAAVSLAAGCKPVTDPGASPSSGSSATHASDGRAVSPLDNPDGTKPGLAAITSAADKAAARDLINQVPTHGTGPKTGYTRDQFGTAWTDSAAGDPRATRARRHGCRRPRTYGAPMWCGSRRSFLKYKLAVTAADKSAMLTQCGG